MGVAWYMVKQQISLKGKQTFQNKGEFKEVLSKKEVEDLMFYSRGH